MILNKKLKWNVFWILFLFILFVFSLVNLFAEDKKIDCYFEGEIIGSIPVEEFQSVLMMSTQYKNILQAEIDKNVKITIQKTPWIIDKEKSVYKVPILIEWYKTINNQPELLKSIELELSMVIDIPNNYPKWRQVYRNIAEIATPILTIVVLIISL
jgi:hypothetical protein